MSSSAVRASRLSGSSSEPETSSRQVAQALVATVRTTPSPNGPPLEALVAGCGVEQLVEMAIAEGLAGPVGQRLGPLIPPEQALLLHTKAGMDKVRHLAYLRTLEKFAAALGQADVAWVALKGPVLAELIYGSVTRGYTDLDLLVPPSQLEGAVRALESAGATASEEEWSEVAKSVKGQVSLSVLGAPLVDLHWHPVYLRSARERWRIPTEELLGRRRPARLGEVDAWILDPEDFAAHVALHASFSAFQQLRRLLDIERTVARYPPNWDVLIRRCHAWRIGLPVSVMLNRARRVLGAEVPEEVILQLAPGPLNRLVLRQLGGWIPAGRLPGHRSLKNALTRCLRDGWGATTAELVGATGQVLAGSFPAGRGGNVNARRGGSTEFEQYLDVVTRADRFGHVRNLEA